MKTLPIAILIGVLGAAAACDAVNAPSPTPTPAPSTTPVPQPVAAGNMVVLSAPGTPPGSSADPLVGRYSLEIASLATGGAVCESVPAHAKRRVYTADIEPFLTYYAVKLYDATFLRDGTSVGYGCRDNRLEMGGVCHQFMLQRGEGSSVTVVMEPEDEWRGSEIWEVLTTEGYLVQLHGNATGTFGDGRIVATGTGSVWYGNGIPASVSSACTGGDMTWSFTRR
jgi:hypothetical protein